MSEPKTIRVLGSGGDYEDHPNPNYKEPSSFAAPTVWAAIETAPKDGTRLLLWEYDQIDIGHWSASVWVAPGGAWIIDENRSDTIELKPTHWQRLPLPPNSPDQLPGE